MFTADARLPRGSALALAVALALGTLAAPAPSTAATPDADDAPAGVLEDIVVTAQRRDESLMTVPIAVSAVGSEAIEKQRMESIEDVLAQVPNVSFVSLGSRDRKEVAIRGVSNQLNPFAADRQSPYGFYIDEYSVSVGTSNPEILDIERIEVLRGPQGTYFGRNAVGGAVNVVTKKPDDTWFSEVGAGIANYGTWEGHAIVNVPIAPGTLAFRGSGQVRRTDGWIVNINPTGGGNDGEFDTARGTLRWTPSERLTWDLNYNRTSGDEGMRVGVPTGFLTRTWRNVYYQGRPGNVASPDGVGFFPNNRDRVNFNRPQSVGSTFDYWSTRFQYDFDAFSLTAVGGKLDATVYNFGDVDGGSIDAFYEDLAIDRDSTSGEIRLQSRGERRIDWSVGLFAGEDRGVLNQKTFHGTQSPAGRANGVEITGADSDTTNEYWAVFGQATWNIGAGFSAVLGGRYSQEDVATIGQSRSNGTITGTNNRTASFDDFSPRLTLSWKHDAVGLLYLTGSKGFKAGGTQTTGTVQLRNDYDPEELWNYEAGWKQEMFERRLRMEVAAFYMDWKNVQQFLRFQFFNAAGNLVGVTGIDNATKATVKGLDFSMAAALTDRWRVGASAGYLDAKYGDWRRALIDGLEIDASGKRLINAPEWTVGLNAEYSRPLTADHEGFVRFEWNYRAEQLSNTFALLYETYPLIAPSYDFANLRVGISGGDRWSLTAYAENVFDQAYFQNSYEKAFYSGVQVETYPRVIGADFRYRFGGRKD